MKRTILTSIIIMYSIFCNAQSNGDLAKGYYLKAEKEYVATNYRLSISTLDEVISLLNGSTFKKVEYLYTMNYYKLKKYVKADEHLQNFFKLNPSNESTMYIELLNITADIKEKAKQKLITDKIEEKKNYIRMLKSIDILLDTRTDFEKIINYDLLPFEQNGKYGYVNKKGDLIVPAKYKEAGYFYNGFAIVSNNDYNSRRSSTGCINEKGEVVIPLRYNQVSSFSKSALAYVRREKIQDEYSSGDFEGFINTSGSKVFSLNENDYLKYKMFSEGFLIKTYNYQTKGFYNTSGQFRPFNCQDADIFQNDLAAVKQNNKWGYINTSMELVIPYQYDKAGRFSDGLAFVVKNGLLGFIDKNGNTVITLQYEYERSISTFKNGFAVVKKNGEYGIINQNGDQISSIKYDSFRETFYGFTQGLVLVKSNGKYGYINNKGEEKVALEYEYAKRFNNGLAAVKLNGKWGYVDTYGEVVIPIKYESASYFFEGKAIVKLNGQTIIIDKKGNKLY